MLLWFAILAYFLLQLGIGVWASRRVHGEADYLLAGRKLGLLLVTFSLFSTWVRGGDHHGLGGGHRRTGARWRARRPVRYRRRCHGDFARWASNTPTIRLTFGCLCSVK
uniref:Sodium:solute symporter family protein n=1 Tax=Candidatus Kentrum sp. SD TaxID=2126332 RepID=A0A451BKU1_9GAMM|nr:MAG: hypothetical protein BECKSD772F_GA0070984_102320 [Candidatus Kentron sp. SD]VFK44224.1 MAG: hypothetical protein BECKSD772E_GA0070983_10359 [Candidatus Kentron sp. SD]VFK78930.1 MAG: hypothetical protein BECKSD772D_GA0070982_102938 [Candidatus Kentron sp. SD]